MNSFSYLPITIFLLIISNGIIGQSEVSEAAFYADVLTNASDNDHRAYANKNFKEELESLLAQSSSFDNEMGDIPWIFTKYSSDRQFRLISWQLQKDENEYEYYSIYQSSDGDYTYFGDNTNEILSEREQYDLTEAYAAVFYEIVSIDDYHLLNAYRQVNNQKTQKICDVLTFNNGKPVIGKAIFNENEKTPKGRGKKRVVVTYSATAKSNMNINANDGIIIFDNIISVPGRDPSQGMMLIPDGSYKAYKKADNGIWLFVDKLYNDIQSTPLNQVLKGGKKSDQIRPKKN